MSAPEMTLDFIKALLWPAAVVVGVFWLVRSECGPAGEAGRRWSSPWAVPPPGLLDAGLARGQLCETGLLEFRDR